MYKILLLLVSLSFVGCAKAKLEPEDLIDPKYTVAQVERELKLPPKPEETHPDYNTYNSVDSNNNKIRDSVERYIGFKHYPDKQKIVILNAFAKSHFERDLSFKSGDFNAYERSLFLSFYSSVCYNKLYGRDLEIELIHSKIKDTEARAINERVRAESVSWGSGLITFKKPINNLKEFCRNKFPLR